MPASLAPAENGRLPGSRDLAPRIARHEELLVMLGVNLLRLGRTEESLRRFDQARELLPKLPAEARPRAEVTLLFHHALAWLRLGENANCVACANGESCLFPIRGGGLHSRPEGSEHAVALLEQLLEHPHCPKRTALTARWLLNVAAMSLGRWPTSVPEPWVIPPRAVAGADFTRFEQIAAGPGLATLSLSGGAVVDDLDGDGLIDVLVSTWHYDGEMHFFHNRCDGSFEDVAREAGVENLRYAKGVTWGDYDDDPDLYVPNFTEPNRLYRTDGAGHFDDVASQVGLERPIMSFPCWFWDVDNDGRLDLYVAAYVEDTATVAASWLGLPHEYEAGRLYLNDGHGGFTDRTEEWGLHHVITTMGANFGDQDVFEVMGGAYAGDSFLDALYENPGFGNHWLRLQLVGAGKNRSALGARVSAFVLRDGTEHLVHRQLDAGGSFGSSPLSVHLGLGRADRAPSRTPIRCTDCWRCTCACRGVCPGPTLFCKAGSPWPSLAMGQQDVKVRLGEPSTVARRAAVAR